jgi:hypothetical protein
MAQDGTAGDVNVSGSQGVVAGTGNTQINNWSPRTPLTPAALAALSPQAAIARIRQLPHDDAVDLFASAPAEVLVPKLKVLLLADEAAGESRAVAILADLDPSKVAELIGSWVDPRSGGGFYWLYGLSKAAEAIAQHTVRLRWDHKPGTGRLERAAQSPKGTGGYFGQYKQGRIYWGDDKGETYAVSGPIADFHLASGGTGGELGFPMKDAITWHSGRVNGRGQEFEGGYLFSSSHGTYSLSLEFWNAWPRWLGFPLAGVEAHDGFTSQRFEEGVLYSSEAGAFAVRSEVAERTGDGWVPISSEEHVHTGRVQRFKPAVGVGEMAVYSSGITGAQRVLGRRLPFYEELGGPHSQLGFPAATARSTPGGYVQRFEHGWIYDRAGRGPVAVPTETVELVGKDLGWPVSQEKAVGGNDDETIQYFEKGAVILRDGKREIWLRQDQGEP